MSTIKIKQVELEVDFLDADFMERYEKAYEAMMKSIESVQQSATAMTDSAGIREVCRVTREYLDAIFGLGTGEKIFGSKMQLQEHLDAVEVISDEAQRQRKPVYDKANQYIQRSQGNRAQRRHDKKHNRGGGQQGNQQVITVTPQPGA